MKIYSFINKILLIILSLFISLSFISAADFPSGKYPSAIVKIPLPGGWEAPTDPQTISEFIQMYGTSSAEMVKRWELENADFFIGADYGKENNEKRLVLGYCYPHLILETSRTVIDFLKKWAIRNQVDYENFSLHFREDTIINATHIKSWKNFWNGFIGAGSTDHSSSYGEDLSGNKDVFRGIDKGGAFFVWAVEPITDIYINLERNGVGGSNMIIEYPSQVDSEFKIVEWKRAEIIQDTTNNFSQSGIIKIKYPSGWKYGRTYPPHGFYQPSFVNERVGAYFLRIKVFNFQTRPLVSSARTTPSIQLIDGEQFLGVVNQGFIRESTATSSQISEMATTTNDFYINHLIKIIDGKGKGQERIITGYLGSERKITINQPWGVIPDQTSQYRIVRRVILIRGWDSRNDRNNDGWVDDGEYQNLINPNATARLKYQSRVIYGEGWADVSGDNAVNVWNLAYQQAIGEFYKESWAKSGLKGCYLDNLTQNNLGNNFRAMYGVKIEPVIIKGGYLIEYDRGRVDEENPSGQDWLNGYKNLIRKMKEITGSQWIGGNIANSNPFTDSYLLQLNEVMDWYTCEDTLHNHWAVNGWGGLGLRPGWIYPALAAKGIPHGLTAHVRNVPRDNNTREIWERRITELLALYYLIQIPGKTAVEFWNSSYWYGSGNTIVNTGYNGFWKAGVPRNYAYIPHRMLRVDIGVQENKIPTGKRPMDLLWDGYGRSTCRYGDCKIGDTTSTTLKVPISSTTDMEIPTIPTYIYILNQINSRNATNQSGTIIPYDAVYARNYTKGLVLYRTLYQYSGLWDGYEDNIATVTLPGLYRKVNYDGSLGPVTNQITMRGFEGAILVKAEYYPPDQNIITDLNKYFKIALFADNYNPQPGDIITYRALIRNISTTTLIKTKFSLPLSTNEKYVSRSAYLTVNNVKYLTAVSYRPHQLIITLPYLSPQQQATLIWKMRR